MPVQMTNLLLYPLSLFPLGLLSPCMLYHTAPFRHAPLHPKLLLVNLGFSMCQIHWSWTKQLSVLYTRKVGARIFRRCFAILNYFIIHLWRRYCQQLCKTILFNFGLISFRFGYARSQNPLCS